MLCRPLYTFFYIDRQSVVVLSLRLSIQMKDTSWQCSFSSCRRRRCTLLAKRGRAATRNKMFWNITYTESALGWQLYRHLCWIIAAFLLMMFAGYSSARLSQGVFLGKGDQCNVDYKLISAYKLGASVYSRGVHAAVTQCSSVQSNMVPPLLCSF